MADQGAQHGSARRGAQAGADLYTVACIFTQGDSRCCTTADEGAENASLDGTVAPIPGRAQIRTAGERHRQQWHQVFWYLKSVRVFVPHHSSAERYSVRHELTGNKKASGLS
jgi:hypothetical protein